jgi:hypothetical protein
VTVPVSVALVLCPQVGEETVKAKSRKENTTEKYLNFDPAVLRITTTSMAATGQK